MEFPFEPRKIWALTKRDIHNWTSYKSQAVTFILTSLIGIASWGFNATYRNVPVPQYNTDYVSFLVVGILISNLILPLQQGLQRRLNPWTLETILMSGVSTPTFVLGTVMWTYIISVVLLIPQIILGVYFFGAHLAVNLISFVVAIFISSLIVFSLAVISTGMRIVTKVTDPVTWGLTVSASLLSGMTFPVQHLNDYVPGLSTVSWILPQTWVYHIIRLAALDNASLLDPSVAISFLVATAFALVMIPLAFGIYRWGLNRAKRDGTLGWY